ncbi:MAG: hypothetical protein PHU07_00655 [Acidocella sp.]|nr:hypothetical protein [Acidocella sp.]
MLASHLPADQAAEGANGVIGRAECFPGLSAASVGPNTSILILSGLRAILSTFRVVGRQER